MGICSGLSCFLRVCVIPLGKDKYECLHSGKIDISSFCYLLSVMFCNYTLRGMDLCIFVDVVTEHKGSQATLQRQFLFCFYNIQEVKDKRMKNIFLYM